MSLNLNTASVLSLYLWIEDNDFPQLKSTVEKCVLEMWNRCNSRTIVAEISESFVSFDGQEVQRKKLRPLAANYDFNRTETVVVESNFSDLFDFVANRLTQDNAHTRSELLPPLVVMFGQRLKGIKQSDLDSLERLLGHESKPRLAWFPWSESTDGFSGAPSEISSSKQILKPRAGAGWTDIQQMFAELTEWVIEKADERVSRAVVPQTSVATTAPRPVEKSRPEITFGDDAKSQVATTQPAESPLPPPSAGIAGEPLPMVFRASNVGDIAGDARVEADLPKRPLLQRWNPLNRNSSKRSESEPSPEVVSEVVGVVSHVVTVDQPIEEIERAEETPSAPRTADGQLIIEPASKINAKPWFAPDWKKLPESGLSRDIEIDCGSVDVLRVIAGSARGGKHQFYGDENQDSYFVARTNSSRFVVAAVSDGVGSAKYSAYGSRALSQLTVTSIVASLNRAIETSEQLDVHSIVKDAIRQASDRMQQWSPGDLFSPPMEPGPEARRQIAATLAVVVVEVGSSENDLRKAWLACVGDSPCYTLRGSEWTIRSTPTKQGELLEHGTSALPVEVGIDPQFEWFEFALSRDEILLLMSDGIGTSLASGNTAVGKWMANQLNTPALLVDFVQTLDSYVDVLTFDRQGEDDDRTMVIIYDFDGLTSEKKPVEGESASSVVEHPVGE